MVSPPKYTAKCGEKEHGSANVASVQDSHHRSFLNTFGVFLLPWTDGLWPAVTLFRSTVYGIQARVQSLNGVPQGHAWASPFQLSQPFVSPHLNLIWTPSPSSHSSLPSSIAFRPLHLQFIGPRTNTPPAPLMSSAPKELLFNISSSLPYPIRTHFSESLLHPSGSD